MIAKGTAIRMGTAHNGHAVGGKVDGERVDTDDLGTGRTSNFDNSLFHARGPDGIKEVVED
jgi:hypothetical protein